MKTNFPKIISHFPVLLFCIINSALAQNGTGCYKPFTGVGKVATPVQNSAVCVDCVFIDSINKVTDNDIENSARFINVVSLIGGNGITVQDTVSTYPAGWFAGYIVDLGSPSLLTANVLNSFEITTYNNGVLAQTKTADSGLAVATVAGVSQSRVYLNFRTSKDFDEIRFRFRSAVTGLNTFRVYYATAFDPNCGTMDGSNVCDDQLAGSMAQVTFNAGSAAVLTTISNPEFITDGNKSTYANVVLPANTDLLVSPPYVGVLDEHRVYPAGQKTGFVVRYESSLLTALVFNSFRLETYLFGELQETATAAGNTLSVDLIGVGGDNKTFSFTTTKKFNETRLVFAQTVSANIGSIGINYVFEEPQTCNSCRDMIMASQPASTPYAGTINASRTGLIEPNSSVCIGGNLNDAGFVTDNIAGNYATYIAPTAGLSCGAHLSVKLSGTVPSGAYAGFVIAKASGLISAAALGDVRITTYRNNVAKRTATGNALLGSSLLRFGSSDLNYIGFVSDSAFDEIEITISNTLGLNLGARFRIYNAFVTRDDDKDGTEDCKEVCGTGSELIDTDGDGTPDACDPGLETLLNLKVILQGPLLKSDGTLSDLMRYDLNQQNFIPNQQPYSAATSSRFAQTGGGGAEAVQSAVLGRRNILSNILVDWVLVELRSSSAPATVVKTVSALVARNGEIVDTLGGPLVVSLPAGNYYVSVKHRNHLGVMTAGAFVTAGARNSVDFATLPPALLFGDGNLARIQILPGVYALWAGDVNSDGKVKYQGGQNDAGRILTNVLDVSANVVLRSYNYDNLLGYLSSDVDLSGKAKYQGSGNDAILILRNILIYGGNLPGLSYNYDLLTEQLP